MVNEIYEMIAEKYNMELIDVYKLLSRRDIPKCLRDEIIEQYSSGKNYIELSAQYNLNLNIIGKILRGKKSAGRPKLFTDDQVREIRRRKWHSGWTLAELADEYKCSAGTIGKIVNKEVEYETRN
jgi:Mor family transcriptional regulator